MKATKRIIKDFNTQIDVIAGDPTSHLQSPDISTDTPFKTFANEE
jgi:hypothetical protein